MNAIKQFKLTNDDEIICEVVQWDSEEESTMIIRGAMRIVTMEDFSRGVRLYAFRPWMGFADDPSVLQSLNSSHIIGELTPGDEIMKQYNKTLKNIKETLTKKNMPLDEVAQQAESMTEEEFEEFLEDYINEHMPDSDHQPQSNVVQFKPKTVH